MKVVKIKYDENNSVSYPDFFCADCGASLIGRRDGDHKDGCVSDKAVAVVGPKLITLIKERAATKGNDSEWYGISYNMIKALLPERA